MAIAKKSWRCPGCGQAYNIPAHKADPSICPDCRDRSPRRAAKPSLSAKVQRLRTPLSIGFLACLPVVWFLLPNTPQPQKATPVPAPVSAVPPTIVQTPSPQAPAEINSPTPTPPTVVVPMPAAEVEPTPAVKVEPKRPEIAYTVINETKRSGIKRSLDILLTKPVTEDDLRSLAGKIKATDPSDYPRTFIIYYLPGMEVGAGGWASTHFEPDLKVRMLYLSPEQESAIAGAATQRAVRVQIHDDTEKRPLPQSSELVFEGLSPRWMLKSATKFGSDGQNVGQRKVGQRDQLNLLPDGPKGKSIVIPFVMTEEMNPVGSPRDAIIIIISDTEVEVVGLPLKAATGEVSMTVQRFQK